MILSKKSWHYRLLSKFQGEENVATNLCGYFWTYLFLCIIALLALFLAVMLLGGMGVTAVKFVSGKHIDTSDHAGFWDGAGVVGWIIMAGVLVVGGILFICLTNNILTKFWKAFIGKYCPKIEWK